MTSLNILIYHEQRSNKEDSSKAVKLLNMVGIPWKKMDEHYPHPLSGGTAGSDCYGDELLAKALHSMLRYKHKYRISSRISMRRLAPHHSIAVSSSVSTEKLVKPREPIVLKVNFPNLANPPQDAYSISSARRPGIFAGVLSLFFMNERAFCYLSSISYGKMI